MCASRGPRRLSCSICTARWTSSKRNKEAIEEALYFRMADLLNLDVELIFYDTTSLHFEIDEEDSGEGEENTVRGSASAGAQGRTARHASAGTRRTGATDAPQVVIGLAVTREGFPVRHWVFPGNTVDVTTVKQVKRDLKGWRLNRCVFVGDAGMVSKDNLTELARGGGRYIVCMPVHPGGEVDKSVVSRPGRYHTVAQNLRVKEVVVGDGERRRRYVVCHNPQEAERQRKHREQVLAELEAELQSLQDTDGKGHSKRVCELRASGRYGRYVRVTHTGKLVIDKAKVKAAARLDGKFVVHSNDDTLSGEDMALGYKQLQRVEESWRQLKSGVTPSTGLSLGRTPHSRPRRAHGVRAVARARGRAGVCGHLAQHPRRSQADQACAIVEPEWDRLAGHRRPTKRP